MSKYVLLKKLKVQGANAVAGVTYGFPSLSGLAGYTHFLSREFSAKFGVGFNGFTIFCHDYELQVYQDYFVKFKQNRSTGLALEGKKDEALKTPSITESGQIDMTISVLLQLDGDLPSNAESMIEYEKALKSLVYKSRVVGGSVHEFGGVEFVTNMQTVKKHIMPAFLLRDASYLLANEKAKNERDIFDIWSDFFSIKHHSVYEKIDQVADDNQSTNSQDEYKVVWQRLEQPQKGWFVPLMLGYKGISPLYNPDEVKGLRDKQFPFQLVEPVHGLGEWISLHKLSNDEILADIMWGYYTYTTDNSENFYLISHVHSSQDYANQVDESQIQTANDESDEVGGMFDFLYDGES